MRAPIHQVLAIILSMLSAVVLAQDFSKAGVQHGAAEPSSVNETTTRAVYAAYELGAGDLLSIHVWKEPDLSRVVPVRPDGNLTLPLIGEIRASGMTAAELQGKITTELRKYLENPDVTVIVQEARSKRFNVVGEVQKPGSFVIAQPTTVLDAVALVGGFRDFAQTKKMYVLRVSGNGTTQRLPFNYQKVIKGENQQQNILLEPGDTVVVP